jgi:hypothetical protein
MPSYQLKFKFGGMYEYMRRLKMLGPQNRLRAMRSILRRTAKVVERNMKSILGGSRKTRNLVSSIKTRLKYYWKNGTVMAIVGVESHHVLIDKYGRRRIAHKYAHIVADGRKAFTQKFSTKLGKKYFVKGHKGLWTATRVIPIQRRVGAVQGIDFVGRAAVGMQARMALAMTRACDTWFEKYDGNV